MAKNGTYNNVWLKDPASKQKRLYNVIYKNGKIVSKKLVTEGIKHIPTPKEIEFEWEYKYDEGEGSEGDDEDVEYKSYKATIKTPEGDAFVTLDDMGYVDFTGKGYDTIIIQIVPNNEIKLITKEEIKIISMDEFNKYLNSKSDKLPPKASQAIKQVINEYNNNEINFGK